MGFYSFYEIEYLFTQYFIFKNTIKFTYSLFSLHFPNEVEKSSLIHGKNVNTCNVECMNTVTVFKF